MAKEQTIVRTFTTYEVLVMCADTARGEMREDWFTFDKPTTDKRVIKILTESLAESNITPLKVIEHKIVNKRYGITKTNFLTNAHLMED